MKRTIKVGNQKWMTQNLNTLFFRNGDAIFLAKSNEDWIRCAINKIPACCFYGNISEIGNDLGLLYNWFAVNDPRELAPIGWEVPDNNSWDELLSNSNGQEFAGVFLKNTFLGNETDSEGFKGLHFGHRGDNGKFKGLSFSSTWWSSMEVKETPRLACCYTIHWRFDRVNFNHAKKEYGFSVLCIKKQNASKRICYNTTMPNSVNPRQL